MNNINQPKILILKSTNYNFWRVEMKLSLCSQDLPDLVQKGYINDIALLDVLKHLKKIIIKHI